MKIMLLILSVIIIPLVVSGVFSTRVFQTKVAEDQLSIVDKSGRIAKSYFDNQSEKNSNLASLIAALPSLQAAVQSNDKSAAAGVLDKYYNEFKDRCNISIMEIGDIEGNVVYRAHNPGKTGDNKKDDVLVKQGLSGQKGWTISEGSSGYAVRYIEPIKAGNVQVGTLMVGRYIDEAFVDSIKKLTKCETTVFFGNTRIATTVINDKGERAVGTTQDNQEILDKVIKNQKIYTGEAEVVGKPFFVSYEPLIDSAGNSVGMLFVGENIERTLAYEKSMLIRQALVGLVCLVIAFVTALAMTRGITGAINKIIDQMSLVASGKLNAKISLKRRDEIALMAEGFNNMAGETAKMVRTVKDISDQVYDSTKTIIEESESVRSSSEQIQSAMHEIGNGSSHQAEAATQAAKVMDDLNADIDKVAEKAAKVGDLSEFLSKQSEKGSQVIGETIAEMRTIKDKVEKSAGVIDELSRNSHRIEEIVSLISGIADQTNLLALNAAIEAARAGEQGRGFAVVADEVRKLAEESSKSAGEITGLIEMIRRNADSALHAMNEGTAETDRGMEVVDKAGKAFEDISNAILQISDGVNGVVSITSEVRKKSQSAEEEITNIAAISEENAAAVEEVAASAAEQTESIGKFVQMSRELGKIIAEEETMLKKFEI